MGAKNSSAESEKSMIPKNACLVARVQLPNIGPCVARLDGERLIDVTAAFPTMRDLCENANAAELPCAR